MGIEEEREAAIKAAAEIVAPKPAGERIEAEREAAIKAAAEVAAPKPTPTRKKEAEREEAIKAAAEIVAPTPTPTLTEYVAPVTEPTKPIISILPADTSTKGLVKVTQAWAETHPEEIVSIEDKYYRPAIAAGETRTRAEITSGIVSGELGLTSAAKGYWSPVAPATKLLALQQQYDETKIGADAILIERWELLGYSDKTIQDRLRTGDASYMSDWVERLEGLSYEDAAKWKDLMDEETVLRNEKNIANSYLIAAHYWDRLSTEERDDLLKGFENLATMGEFRSSLKPIVSGSSAEGFTYDIAKIAQNPELAEKFDKVMPGFSEIAPFITETETGEVGIDIIGAAALLPFTLLSTFGITKAAYDSARTVNRLTELGVITAAGTISAEGVSKALQAGVTSAELKSIGVPNEMIEAAAVTSIFGAAPVTKTAEQRAVELATKYGISIGAARETIAVKEISRKAPALVGVGSAFILPLSERKSVMPPGGGLWELVAPIGNEPIIGQVTGSVEEGWTGTLFSGKTIHFATMKEYEAYLKGITPTGEQPFLPRSAEEFRAHIASQQGRPGADIYATPLAILKSPVGAITAGLQYWLQPYKTTGEKWEETGIVAAGFTGVPSIATGITNRDIFNWSAGSLHLNIQQRANVAFQGALQLAMVTFATKSAITTVASKVKGAPSQTIEVQIPQKLTNRLANLTKEYAKTETELNTAVKQSGSMAVIEKGVGGFEQVRFYPEMGPKVQTLYAKLQKIQSQIVDTQKRIIVETKIKGQPEVSGIKYEPFEIYTDRYLSPKDLKSLSETTVTKPLGKVPVGDLTTYLKLQEKVASLKYTLDNIRGMSKEAIAQRQKISLELDIARTQLANLQLGSGKAAVSAAEQIIRASYERAYPMELPKLSLYGYEPATARFAPRIYEPFPPGWEPLVEYGKRAAPRVYKPFVPAEIKGMTVEEFLSKPSWVQKALSDPVKYAEWIEAEAKLQAYKIKVDKLIEAGKTKGSKWDAALDEMNKAKVEVEAAKETVIETIVAERPAVVEKMPSVYSPAGPFIEPSIWAVTTRLIPLSLPAIIGIPGPEVEPIISPEIEPLVKPTPSPIAPFVPSPVVTPSPITTPITVPTPTPSRAPAPVLVPILTPAIVPITTLEPVLSFAPEIAPAPITAPFVPLFTPTPIPPEEVPPPVEEPHPPPLVPPAFPLLFPGVPGLVGGVGAPTRRPGSVLGKMFSMQPGMEMEMPGLATGKEVAQMAKFITVGGVEPVPLIKKEKRMVARPMKYRAGRAKQPKQAGIKAIRTGKK